jgi:hypothetical protein
MLGDSFTTPDHLYADPTADLYCSEPNLKPTPLEVVISTVDFLGQIAGLGFGLLASSVNYLHDKIDSM